MDFEARIERILFFQSHRANRYNDTKWDRLVQYNVTGPIYAGKLWLEHVKMVHKTKII